MQRDLEKQNAWCERLETSLSHVTQELRSTRAAAATSAAEVARLARVVAAEQRTREEAELTMCAGSFVQGLLCTLVLHCVLHAGYGW